MLSAILAMSLAIGTTGGMPIAAESEDIQAEAFAGRELWAPETEEEAAPPNTEGDLSPAQLQTAQLSPEEIPEAVSKEDIAERGHVHRLWKQEEDANSIVFQNRDGTKTLYYFTEAVKYVDENGAVQDKSNTLQDIGSASSASGYRYVNGFNDIKTYFPAQLGSETGLLLKHGDIQIELTPAYAQRGETAEAGAPAEEEPADPKEAESADVPEDADVSEDTAAEAGEAAGTPPTSSAVPFEAADDAAILVFPEENSTAASTPASDPSPVLPSPTAMESEETAPTGPSGTMPGTTEAGEAAGTTPTSSAVPFEAADNTAAFPETTLPAEPILPPVPEAAVDNAPILAKHSVPAEKKAADPDGHTADTVEYAEVFGEHTALRYTPTFSGFKEDIVLSENIGRNEFTFELQTGGLSLAQEGETVGLFDPLTGERVAMLDNILVFDSGGPAADEGEEIVPRHHYYRVETVEPDALYQVTVVVDEAFLNDPGTVYPVVIDPAITLTGSSGGIEDATIYSNYLVNEGSSGSVFVGSYNARYGGTRGVARTLVRFPGLLNSTVYQSLDSDMISSVSLRIRDLMCESDAVKINAYRMTSGWTEDTVKCSGAIWDSYNQAVLSSSTVQYGNGYDSAESSVTGGQWYRFDITSAVKGWKAGTYAHHGIMLRANSETNAAKTFASSDRSSYQPVVVMNYTSPTTTPPGVTNGGTYYIQNVCSGLYLNLQGNGTANNTPAIQSSLAYKTSQRFKLVRDSSGYYRIQAQNTTAKRVLLLNTSNQVVLSDDCSSSRALWRIKDEGGGQYSFINKATETYAMSNANNGTSGSAVKGEIYSSATQQKWKLNKAVTSLSLQINHTNMNLGDFQNISIQYFPTDSIDKSVSWSSSNEGIIAYQSNGICAQGIGSATITASLTSNPSIKTSKVIVVKDNLSDIYSSLSRPEFFYITYPSGINVISHPLMPPSPIISELPLEKKLLSIPISRKYAGTNNMEEMQEELNAALGTNYSINTVERISGEYDTAVSSTPPVPGHPPYTYTPESVEYAQENYMGILKVLITLVTFKLAAELNPFDANGNILFKPDKFTKFYDSNGKPIWPGTNGNVHTDGFMNGYSEPFTFETGDTFDRYGSRNGQFVAPVGTPYSCRSLAPGSYTSTYEKYIVKKPFSAYAGFTAPWFNQAGGGIQYKLPMSIQELIDAGYISILS